MRYEIRHELPGRVRVHCRDVNLTPLAADALCRLLSLQEGVSSASASPRTGNLLIIYSRILSRRQVLALLEVLTPDDWDGLEPAAAAAPSLFEMAAGALLSVGFTSLLRRLLPAPIRFALTLAGALPYVMKGALALLAGKINIAVLDAVALTILALRRDAAAIRAMALLFAAADALEGRIREESRKSLAESLALKIDAVWLKTLTGEARRPLDEVRPGDLVIVRAGAAIPVDGVVAEGEAFVNQSILTGESAPEHKTPGASVFAGAVVDEGEIVILTEKTADATRLWGIARFIEESETLKAGVQSKAERLADAIVPYSLSLAMLVLILTRSPARAAAVLVVDYSCAMRLATPLAIVNAMREGIGLGILIKGGKYVEELALADTLALDKTGTLTLSQPRVAGIAAFNGWSGREALRTTACIEEHFPHPVARAVVREAERRRLGHREKHAKPEYVLAHGVVCDQDGKRVVVGSSHFVFEDMKIPLTAEAEREMRRETGLGRSVLFMAHDGAVAGMLSIDDPVRPDAAAALAGLARCGMRREIMLTGDGERTAGAVAAELGLDAFHARLLPADKAEWIRSLKQAGGRVMFVGDGVNDSPALSAADVGVSLKDGADIAREVAGVVLLDGRLSSLLTARLLSLAAISRINWQFACVMIMNSLLIGLGFAGLISPRLAAILHNLGTVAVTANSVRRLLPVEAEGEEPKTLRPATEAGLGGAEDEFGLKRGSA